MPEETSPRPESGAPPRKPAIVAVALAVAFAVAVAVIGLTSGGSAEEPAPEGSLALVPVPAPEAGSEACRTLLAASPQELPSGGEMLTRRELAEPAPHATAAWGGHGAADPVVLRCGLDRPPELTPTSQLRVVNGVQWLPVPGPGKATWYTVDRGAYVALTVPDPAGTGPLQQLSRTIGETLPHVQPTF